MYVFVFTDATVLLCCFPSKIANNLNISGEKWPNFNFRDIEKAVYQTIVRNDRGKSRLLVRSIKL